MRPSLTAWDLSGEGGGRLLGALAFARGSSGTPNLDLRRGILGLKREKGRVQTVRGCAGKAGLLQKGSPRKNVNAEPLANDSERCDVKCRKKGRRWDTVRDHKAVMQVAFNIELVLLIQQLSKGSNDASFGSFKARGKSPSNRNNSRGAWDCEAAG